MEYLHAVFASLVGPLVATMYIPNKNQSDLPLSKNVPNYKSKRTQPLVKTYPHFWSKTYPFFGQNVPTQEVKRTQIDSQIYHCGWYILHWLDYWVVLSTWICSFDFKMIRFNQNRETFRAEVGYVFITIKKNWMRFIQFFFIILTLRELLKEILNYEWKKSLKSEFEWIKE